MLDIPTPTTSTCALSNGIIAQVTKWNLGEYTLYRFEEPNYTGWSVTNADRNLPRIDKNSPELTPAPEFGVSCASIVDMAPTEAIASAPTMTTPEIAVWWGNTLAAAATTPGLTKSCVDPLDMLKSKIPNREEPK